MSKPGTYTRTPRERGCMKCGAQIVSVRSDAQCKSCKRAYLAQWKTDNPDYYKNFPRDPVKEAKRNRIKRQKYAEKYRQAKKRYHDSNPGLKTLWDANRRAAEKQATPLWANSFFITEAYALAKLREKVCGGKWHVDHIVPLQSKQVCGLHVEHNLQVIPAATNNRKSNCYWPEKP